MLPHALTEGEIPFVRSANGNGNGIPLNRIPFNGIPFPFISIKQIFESSISVRFRSFPLRQILKVKIPFPLMALCFRVNLYFILSCPKLKRDMAAHKAGRGHAI